MYPSITTSVFSSTNLRTWFSRCLAMVRKRRGCVFARLLARNLRRLRSGGVVSTMVDMGVIPYPIGEKHAQRAAKEGICTENDVSKDVPRWGPERRDVEVRRPADGPRGEVVVRDAAPPPRVHHPAHRVIRGAVGLHHHKAVEAAVNRARGALYAVIPEFQVAAVVGPPVGTHIEEGVQDTVVLAPRVVGVVEMRIDEAALDHQADPAHVQRRVGFEGRDPRDLGEQCHDARVLKSVDALLEERIVAIYLR